MNKKGEKIMKFTAVGDLLIQRRIQADYPGFEELAPFIKQGDARFFNLETTLNHEGEASASAFSGGTYIRTNPEVLEDIKNFGFNMTSFNNNHALDFFYDGFEHTLKAVEKSGFVHSGAGRNLGEASAPKYLDTNNGRIALISVNSNFDVSMMAGEQTSRVKGRPGINGLRLNQKIVVTKEELEQIKRIAKASNINAGKEFARREGYYAEVPENEAELGNLKFIEGEKTGLLRTVNKNDMERVERAIYEAKLKADYIMISIHSHQVGGDKKEDPAEFLIEFAHKCIDLGANAVVGHGPHLLRPIEVYKDSPIFYSLGDFITELYDVDIAPYEFFEKHDVDANATVHELLKTRSKNFTTGLMEDKRMMMTVIPCWETDENNKLVSIKLMPVKAPMKGNKSLVGLPRRTDDPELYTYLKDMCAPYGTEVVLEADGTYSCRW